MNILDKEFQTHVAEQLKITDVGKALHENLSQQHHYFQLLIECKKDMREISENLDGVYQELMHYYKFDYSFQLKTANELEAYIKNNKKYKEINRIYQLKKLEEEVLTETIKMFQSRAFTLNKIVEFLGLEKR